jgi:hypothetical protein
VVHTRVDQRWWALRDSNPRPPPCKRAKETKIVALPGLMAHPKDTESRKRTPEPPLPVSIRCQLISDLRYVSEGATTIVSTLRCER